MKTKLVEFVAKQQGNMVLAQGLVNRFAESQAPGFILSTNETFTHVYDAYKSKGSDSALLSKMASWLFERERFNAKDGATQFYLPDKSISEKEKMKVVGNQTIGKRALSFALYGIGECAARASYACLQFLSIFEHAQTQVKINLFSNVVRDHYIVLLSDDRETVVYDPLVNPEYVYNRDFYQKNILIKYFKKIPQEIRSKYQINHEVEPILLELFNKYVNLYLQANVNFGSLDDIRSDIEYRIREKEFGGKLEDALALLQGKYIDWQQRLQTDAVGAIRALHVSEPSQPVLSASMPVALFDAQGAQGVQDAQDTQELARRLEALNPAELPKFSIADS
jgi:hypothetical protein